MRTTALVFAYTEPHYAHLLSPPPPVCALCVSLGSSTLQHVFRSALLRRRSTAGAGVGRYLTLQRIISSVDYVMWLLLVFGIRITILHYPQHFNVPPLLLYGKTTATMTAQHRLHKHQCGSTAFLFPPSKAKAPLS